MFGAFAGGGAAIGLLAGGLLTEYLNWRSSRPAARRSCTSARRRRVRWPARAPRGGAADPPARRARGRARSPRRSGGDAHLALPHMRAFWERRMDYLETDLDIRFLTMHSPYRPSGDQ
ncbi:hypothetical protein ACWC5I_45865 [Kitasatospora sp. NPDC001574]